MGRKLDDLWVYADRLINKRFKCHFCLKDFPGGVVRLRSHLSGVKGGGVQLCTRVSEEAKNDALSSLNVVNKKRKTGPRSSDSDGGSSDICDANCNSEVGYSLAKFFFMAGINHNMAESSCFTSFIKVVSPGSALPSSVELESKLIPSFKTEVEQYVSDTKKSWKETGCTLIPMFELNEKGGRSFLSIFGCTRERIVLLDAVEVPTNIDLVAPNLLQQFFHGVVEAVGSHNVVQCVVDASQYGEKFSKFLGSKFPHVYLTKCVAHEVQLMFEEICLDVGWVGRTFTIIKSIVDYVCSDTAILALIRKYTNGKELKQSSGVNLLSSYKMLESILEVKEHLIQLVQSPEWLADYGKEQCGIEVTTYIKDPQTWKWVEEVQKGLRSLSQVLCSVDFHDSGSGYLYGLMEIVEHSFSQHWNNNQDIYKRLRDIYMLKKDQILTEFHSVAAFLNPAYMRTEQAKNVDWNPVISTILGRFVVEGDREDFVDEVQEYMKILSDETKLFETTAAKAYHPCQWWEKCVKKQTMLRNLAIRILSQPCSTSTCKSSMCTVEALLVKEQREARAITNLDLKMNAILMEEFKKDKPFKKEKIVLEEFSKHMSNNGELTSRTLRQLKLCFLTDIASPIHTSQNVEGEKGRRIHVCLEDPSTGRVVQDEIPSTLQLTITVLDGHFSNEASSDGRTGREYFNINELTGSYMTGDLKVNLIRGEGTLGTFSFNCSSGCTESGKFKLAVKTQIGDYAGFRILEGISNAFIVEDAEEVSTELPMANVDPHNDSFSGNTGQQWFSNTWIPNESDSHLEGIGDAYMNYQFSGFTESLAQTAARRVKKKAQMQKVRSHGRGVTFKRESQALGRKRIGKGVLKPRRAVYSSGSNNVNQQDDGEEVNSEPVKLEGIDCLSSTSVMTLFGVRVGSSSGAKPVGETNAFALPTHPSNALQLSLTPDRVLELREVELGSANNVNQQPESPAIMLFGVQVAGSGAGETDEGHSPTAPVILTTEDSKVISYRVVRKRPLGRCDAEVQEPGGKAGTFDTAAEAAMAYDAVARQFLGPYLKTNFPITSEPEINSAGRGNQISNEDDMPHEVEENRFVGDNYDSDSSVKSTPAKKEVKSTENGSENKTSSPRKSTQYGGGGGKELKAPERVQQREAVARVTAPITPRMYTFSEMRSVTNGFSPDSVLGQGWFGTVFRGWVDGRTLDPAKVGVGFPVAVKRSEPYSEQGLQELQAEVKLGKFSHPNPVRLLGYCWEDRQFLLMYEYMQKSSLENHLFRKVPDPIPWDLLLKIAIGAARGLDFLHASEMSVFYRDFKSSNFLLDSQIAANQKETKTAAAGGPEKDEGHVTVVLKTEMHCDGCAEKVKRIVKQFKGVNDVNVDIGCKKLTVVGKVFDPAKLRQMVEDKTKRRVELLSPLPGKKASADKKPADSKPEKKDDKPAQKKEEDKNPKESTVVLKINLHCEGCITKIKSRISKIDGVNFISIDASKDLVTIKGTMEAKDLATTLQAKFRRTVRVVPPMKEELAKEGGGGGGDKKAKEAAAGGSTGKKPSIDKKKVDENKMENHGYANMPPPPIYGYYSGGDVSYGGVYQNVEPYRLGYGPVVQYNNGYAIDPRVGADSPQMFSDENTNACSIM